MCDFELVFACLMVCVPLTACGAAPAPCPDAVEDRAEAAGAPQSIEHVHTARSIECNAHPAAVNVMLGVTDDYEHFVGRAVDNYDMLEFPPCRETATEIVCAGTWQHAGEPGELRITVATNGLLVARLRLADGQESLMACLASNNPLSVPTIDGSGSGN